MLRTRGLHRGADDLRARLYRCPCRQQRSDAVVLGWTVNLYGRVNAP